MEKKKPVRSSTDKKDGRRRLLVLTPKAKRMVSLLRPLWDTMRIVAGEIYNHNGTSLLRAIENTESALFAETYYDRFRRVVASEKKLA